MTLGGESSGLYTANCSEPVWSPTESGATFYLSITIASGTVAYRVSQ